MAAANPENEGAKGWVFRSLSSQGVSAFDVLEVMDLTSIPNMTFDGRSSAALQERRAAQPTESGHPLAARSFSELSSCTCSPCGPRGVAGGSSWWSVLLLLGEAVGWRHARSMMLECSDADGSGCVVGVRACSEESLFSEWQKEVTSSPSRPSSRFCATPWSTTVWPAVSARLSRPWIGTLSCQTHAFVCPWRAGGREHHEAI